MKKKNKRKTNQNLELDEDNFFPKKKKLTTKRKKRKLKRKAWFILIVITIIIGISLYLIIKNIMKKEQIQNDEKYLESIKSHYSEVVKTNNKTNLYIRENDKFISSGTIYSDVILELDSIDINLDTKYFKIKDSDYYIEYASVDKTNDKKEENVRYKNYLPFNKNVVTKDNFTLYDGDKEIISFTKGTSFPIIINNYNNRYYVEYDNRLLSIKSDDVSEIVDANNTTKKNKSYITTLCYHRVYDTNEKCTDPYVCIKKSSFDEEMKYLSDNNYFTLTMEEMYMYLKGNLQVEKAVTITFDDGYLYQSAEDVLEKYNLNGTMFVISSFFDDLTQFDNLEKIDIQSHTHNMHRNYVCTPNTSGSQGGAILCASENDIKNDLETSLKKLNVEPWGLAFPFYDYNEKAIKVLKEVGFKMSFVGRAGVLGKAYPNKTNLYKIPRMTVWEQSIMSFNKWKSYL